MSVAGSVLVLCVYDGTFGLAEWRSEAVLSQPNLILLSFCNLSLQWDILAGKMEI